MRSEKGSVHSLNMMEIREDKRILFSEIFSALAKPARRRHGVQQDQWTWRRETSKTWLLRRETLVYLFRRERESMEEPGEKKEEKTGLKDLFSDRNDFNTSNDAIDTKIFCI